jgi:hypothetical protein
MNRADYDAKKDAFRKALARAKRDWSDKAAFANAYAAAIAMLEFLFADIEGMHHAIETVGIVKPFHDARARWAKHATKRELKDFDSRWHLHEEQAANDAKPPPPDPPSVDEICKAFGDTKAMRAAVMKIKELRDIVYDGAFLDYDVQFAAFFKDAKKTCRKLPPKTVERIAAVLAERMTLADATKKR